jgi:hypothetical protein
LPNAWVRLRRIGGFFTAFHSADGQTWNAFAELNSQAVGGVNGGFNPTVYVGLATTAQAANGTTLARFSQFGFGTDPSILTGPESQTIAPGQSIRLAVVAGGVEPIRYQWRLNGVNIPGATQSSFVIPEASPTDGGSYSVVVASPTGIIESEPALVSVLSEFLPLSDAFGAGPSFSNPSGVRSARNLGATLQPGEPPHANRPGGSSVWFAWTAPQNGPVEFRTRGSSFDTLLAAYTGNTLANLTPVAADDDKAGFGCSLIRFNAVANRTYHLAIDGLGGAQGQIVLTWQLVPGPPIPVVLKPPQNQVVELGQSALFEVGPRTPPPSSGCSTANRSPTRWAPPCSSPLSL